MTEMENTKKLKVDIYVPLDACACQWENFMNSVFSALMPYKDRVDFQTKNLNSEKARELNLRGSSIVIDDQKVITSSYNFKRILPKILEEKGLD